MIYYSRYKMSSKRTILSRPRTKLYDSNYNIGESYYRPALDRLDRKYSGRPLSPVRSTPTPFSDIADRHARIFADEDLDASRRRAASHIREEHLFDSRGGRVTRAQALDQLDQQIDEEGLSTARRYRSNKMAAHNDIDLESTSNNLKTHRMLDRSEKLLDTVGINDSYSRRRMMAEATDEEVKPSRKALKDMSSHVKWAVPVENGLRASRREESESNVAVASVRASSRKEEMSIETSHSAAAARARQTKARIGDIEEEMQAMQEKQAAREARVARLRALVAETEMESAELEKQQMRVDREQARKEKELKQFG
ncbi:unnamed protein product [Callosobruchus maculatus]|uniref:Uncharacterized protein n=2 Tax=Callosobruchus maculatus TaxID=64391 RepID=A0A653CA74_CALMS|nr:unnamed protein product [Callosobruchus maculatus]